MIPILPRIFCSSSPPFQAIRNRFKRTNYNCYHYCKFFRLSGKVFVVFLFWGCHSTIKRKQYIFPHKCLLMVFHWSLSYNKFPQVSFQYSSWSQQCCSLDGFQTSSDFQLFQPHFQAFRGHYKRIDYKYHYHTYVSQLALFSGHV